MIQNKCVNQAIDYIYQHINEPVTLEDVCEHCHISKYYFGRLFKAETGEGVYEFIKRLKLEQSAFRMKVEKSRSITEIAQKYGYSSSNYSTAFRKQKGENPAAYRRKLLKNTIEHPYIHHGKLGTFEECAKNITIEVVEDIKVLYERRIGSYDDMQAEWCEFHEKYREFQREDTVFYECTLDDPSVTKEGGCVYDICMSVDDTCELSNTRMLQGGKFLIYHFEGDVKDIYKTYQTFFHVYLPEVSYEIDERYGFDRYYYYTNGQTKIDIHFPIK